MKIKGLYLLDSKSYDKIYGPTEREQISQLVDIYAPPQTQTSIVENPSLLGEADVIISGWGCPQFDEVLISAAPRLKVIFYGAGSIKGIVTDAFWQSGIFITSAYAANAEPVCEFALSQIFLSLKRYWQHVEQYRRTGKHDRFTVPGAYGSIVGLVSLGMIGRMIAERLKTYDLKVLAYDPYAKPEVAQQLGVELCSLDDVFQRSDVVSVHTPWLPETEGLITGRHFSLMKPGAMFINTSRGAVIRENEMIEALQKRPDLFALLDVTYPEPPLPGSPLFSLPNVVLTPHIAGAMDNECRRMGQLVIGEIKRYLNGEPLRYRITREQSLIMA